jgi:diguanylate cyclase (GGDEF)-like protein
MRLKAELRREDLLSRLGGEEFAVLLGGLTAPEVVELGKRLLQAIAVASVVIPGAAIDVRISIGAVQRRQDEGLDSLLQWADEALYAAKSTGRNRLVHDLDGSP